MELRQFTCISIGAAFEVMRLYFNGGDFENRPYWKFCLYRSRVNRIILTQVKSLHKILPLMKCLDGILPLNSLV